MTKEIRKYQVKNAVALTFSIHSWGNRKAADMEKVETATDKDLLNLTKNLIERRGEYRDVIQYMNTTRSLLERKSVPSFFREGLYLFNINFVDDIEKFLAERAIGLQKLVDSLAESYPEKIKEVKDRLGDQFNANDYPSAGYIRRAFYFSYQWIAFDVPEGLPKDIFNAEKKKAEEMWADAAEKIVMCLREGFKKLIAHAVDVLAVGEDGKTKRFKDASFESINEFIDSFKNRNLVGDSELASLVDKAKKILADVDDPQSLKSDDRMREFVQKGFSDINIKLSKMVVDKPTRKFSFDE